ncbi:MAG: thioredoxin domain-containing protein [Chloroflexi bacterium]|nr:thioredoxin domain-containing protein [Chloroflexota bacterium]
MPNRLVHETSPYLLQHAHNPVDWYPWGEEAFARARAEDRPVLLSVGYSACHWCHVMERESFQDPGIAQLMNEHFVSIKVDREERPDVDSIYMQAVMSVTGRGGWPMTVFLTPEGKPFYGGTYFPPDDRHGMPGFPRVLKAVAEAYRDRRGELELAAEQLAAHLRSGVATAASQEPVTPEALTQAYQRLTSQFDRQHGGLGGAPKFPQAMAHEFLLRYHARTQDPEALAMVEYTLERMARGGIYDQLGGGFHRYATDSAWLVPHFEKMLYDNALLGRLYLHAYQVTGQAEFRRVVEETLDYVRRDMTGAPGGFYSAQDADSEGAEGRYYVWSAEEMAQVLGTGKAETVGRYYGLATGGNFDGLNILHVPREPAEVAQELRMSEAELAALVQEARGQLLARRQERVPPARDEKVLTAWNGLMLRTFAEAGAALGRADYVATAVANATFLLQAMRQDGRLLRTYKDGEARLRGYLEDYAFLAEGLLALHEATLDLRWLQEVRGLADAMIDLFWDDAEGAFYDTGRDHEALIVRPRDVFDNSTPCGGSQAAETLLRLGVLTGDEGYTRRATRTLRSMKTVMVREPLAFGQWLCALDFYLSPPKEIALIGPREDSATQGLLDEVHRRFLPNKVVTGWDPERTPAVPSWPLLEDKWMLDGRPAAYVCQNYACQAPVTDPRALAEQLTS